MTISIFPTLEDCFKHGLWNIDLCFTFQMLGLQEEDGRPWFEGT